MRAFAFGNLAGRKVSILACLPHDICDIKERLSVNTWDSGSGSSGD